MTRARAHKLITEQTFGPATAMTNLDFRAAVWTAFNLPIPTGHAWRRPALPGLQRRISNHQGDRSPNPGIVPVPTAGGASTAPATALSEKTKCEPADARAIKPKAGSTPANVQSPNGSTLRTFVPVRRENDGPVATTVNDDAQERTTLAADMASEALAVADNDDLFGRSGRASALDLGASQRAEAVSWDSLPESGAASMRVAEPAHSRGANKHIAAIIGSRMRKARIYNGYSLEEASARLGHDLDHDKLSSIEGGKATVPIWVLVRARALFSVPVDYFLGLADEIEATSFDCRQIALRDAILETTRASLQNVADHMGQALGAAAPSIAMARALVDKAEQFSAAYDRFVELNPKALNLRGGANLNAAAKALESASKDASHRILRHDNLGAAAVEAERRRLASGSLRIEARGNTDVRKYA